MIKRLLDCSASDFTRMNKIDILQSIEAGVKVILMPAPGKVPCITNVANIKFIYAQSFAIWRKYKENTFIWKVMLISSGY